MKKIVKIFILLMVLFLVYTVAFALDIDFRSSDFSGVQGENSFSTTINDLDIGLMAFPVASDVATMTYNVGSGGNDGIGIDYSYEYDEIEDSELLAVTFSDNVYLSEIFLTDLFIESRDDHEYHEQGFFDLYYLNLFPFNHIEFIQDGSDVNAVSNGEFHYTFDVPVLVNIIAFGAPGKIEIMDGNDEILYTQDHEFSLAGLTVNPVPEPATLLLFGTGLMGLAGFGKKFKKN